MVPEATYIKDHTSALWDFQYSIDHNEDTTGKFILKRASTDEYVKKGTDNFLMLNTQDKSRATIASTYIGLAKTKGPFSAGKALARDRVLNRRGISRAYKKWAQNCE